MGQRCWGSACRETIWRGERRNDVSRLSQPLQKAAQPIGGSASNAAHATTTLEDAQRLMPERESVTGEPQEIVKYDLSN
jgi:hypothetical protein